MRVFFLQKIFLFMSPKLENPNFACYNIYVECNFTLYWRNNKKKNILQIEAPYSTMGATLKAVIKGKTFTKWRGFNIFINWKNNFIIKCKTSTIFKYSCVVLWGGGTILFEKICVPWGATQKYKRRKIWIKLDT